MAVVALTKSTENEGCMRTDESKQAENRALLTTNSCFLWSSNPVEWVVNPVRALREKDEWPGRPAI